MKNFLENSSFVKSFKNNSDITIRCMCIYCNILFNCFLKREMLHLIFAELIKAHILRRMRFFFFPKIVLSSVENMVSPDRLQARV